MNQSAHLSVLYHLEVEETTRQTANKSMSDNNKPRQNPCHWGTGQKELSGIGAGCELDSVLGKNLSVEG